MRVSFAGLQCAIMHHDTVHHQHWASEAVWSSLHLTESEVEDANLGGTTSKLVEEKIRHWLGLKGRKGQASRTRLRRGPILET